MGCMPVGTWSAVEASSGSDAGAGQPGWFPRSRSTHSGSWCSAFARPEADGARARAHLRRAASPRRSQLATVPHWCCAVDWSRRWARADPASRPRMKEHGRIREADRGLSRSPSSAELVAGLDGLQAKRPAPPSDRPAWHRSGLAATGGETPKRPSASMTRSGLYESLDSRRSISPATRTASGDFSTTDMVNRLDPKDASLDRVEPRRAEFPGLVARRAPPEVVPGDRPPGRPRARREQICSRRSPRGRRTA